MRPPSDLPTRQRAAPRGRRWILVAIAVVILLIASVHTFANFYTDALWFSSVHLHSVWSSLFVIKVGLMVTFVVLFALLLLGNLIVAERLAPRGPAMDAEDDFVRNYREVMGPYSRWIRIALVTVLSLVMGSQALGQWNNWILFRNAVPFGVKDPQFGKDVGYFVFKLPFELFMVHWAFVALFVILIVTVVSHYLNGGIRTQGPRPRVRPAVKAHISLLLGLIALVKAAGYVLQRYSLETTSNSPLGNGIFYTDIHARIPALDLLFLVSLAAFGLLIINIRRQGWTLPILGVGLWFLVALAAGTIYPAAVQALKVNPAQNTLESQYIQRNIDATRAAMGITSVQNVPFPASSNLTATQLNANSDTLSNVRLWDSALTSLQPTYDKLQDIRSFYQFDPVALDRYTINGAETPATVAVREINDQDLPSNTWINTHLQYTHGYGMIVAPANQATSNGDPQFDIGYVPPVSTNGLPTVTQPSVYFGLDPSTYVVANTEQPEIDYQKPDGTFQESHYSGDGGVQLSSFFKQLMFAVRFNDYNLLISSKVTSKSRLIFDNNVKTMVSKAAPFLSLDSDPYPALIDGHIDWIQDAYTTSSEYPYAQTADTSAVASSSGLPSNFNYVRNSVKVVIDAYSGQMTFYVMDPSDPIIQAYEKAFPKMFTPASKMDAALKAHIRYPEDIFTVQATMYGKYHLTTASSFYSAAGAWTLSPSPGSGSPSQALANTTTTNAQGQTVYTNQIVRMSPIYQVLQVPGQTTQTYNLLDAFVPVSTQNQIQTLSGFMIAGSDPGHYGQLQVFVTPQGQPVDGPSIVAARIDATQSISKEISLLNQEGSNVLLGNVLMIPIADSLLYVQPLYVQSSRNNFPELQEVIAVYGKQAAYGDTLADALTQVFSAPVETQQGSAGTSGLLSPQIRALLNDAQTQYEQSQTDLKAGNLGAYQTDITNMEQDLQQVQQLSGGTSVPGAGGSGTTGNGVPSGSTTTTTTTAGSGGT